jgi:hypothetical protein
MIVLRIIGFSIRKNAFSNSKFLGYWQSSCAARREAAFSHTIFEGRKYSHLTSTISPATPSRPPRGNVLNSMARTNNALAKWLQMIQSDHLKLLTAILQAPGCALAGFLGRSEASVMANISKTN